MSVSAQDPLTKQALGRIEQIEKDEPAVKVGDRQAATLAINSLDWSASGGLELGYFHRKRLNGMAGAIVDTVDASLDAWIAHPQININEALMCVTLSIAFRLLLNRDQRDQDVTLISASFREAVNYLSRRLKQFVEWPVPSGAKRH